MKEEVLISKLKNREEAAIDYVITKYSRLLWPIADAVLKNVGSTQDVEECVADAFIHLWAHPEKLDPQRGCLKSWLCMVVRSRAIDRYRDLTRRSTVPLESAMMAGRMGVQDALLREETRRELIAAVNALADLEKDILIRRYFYEQKPKEIARALDLSVKQVDNYLYRSKQKLRHAVMA